MNPQKKKKRIRKEWNNTTTKKYNKNNYKNVQMCNWAILIL